MFFNIVLLLLLDSEAVKRQTGNESRERCNKGCCLVVMAPRFVVFYQSESAGKDGELHCVHVSSEDRQNHGDGSHQIERWYTVSV